MEFQTEEFSEETIVVINLPDRVAAETSDQLKGYVKQLVESGKFKLVMNLEKTKFMDSAGLGALVSKISVTRANQGDVRLACPHQYITNLLELTHLDQIMKSFSSVRDAVKSYEE